MRAILENIRKNSTFERRALCAIRTAPCNATFRPCPHWLAGPVVDHETDGLFYCFWGEPWDYSRYGRQIVVFEEYEWLPRLGLAHRVTPYIKQMKEAIQNEDLLEGGFDLKFYEVILDAYSPSSTSTFYALLTVALA
jgi:hypothetical protein